MLFIVGRDISVSIATELYWLSLWGREFPHPSRPALGTKYHHTNGYQPGRALTTRPHLKPRLKEETLEIHLCVCVVGPPVPNLIYMRSLWYWALLKIRLHDSWWARIAQSIYRLAMGWKVRESNPSGGGQLFCTRPHRTWGPPSLLPNVYRVIPGLKTGGAWRWTPTPYSAEVKERVDVYHNPPSCLYGRLAWTSPFGKKSSRCVLILYI